MEVRLDLNERDPHTVDLFSGLTDKEATMLAGLLTVAPQQEIFDPRCEQGVCACEVPTRLKAA